jgi:uncharacterized membrane protein
MVATSVYMIVFRLVHIAAGLVWVGSLFMLVRFIQPSAQTLGPTAGPFLQELLARRRLPTFLLGTGAVTIAAGLFLYWRDWQLAGSLGDWVTSTYGAVLTVGSLFAIAAFLVGLLGVKPTLDRMLPLAARLAEEASPSEEGMAEVQSLQARSRRLAITVLVLLGVAVVAMATARYW